MIIFDCEIKKAILGKGESPIEGVEYCGGWKDFKNMGVSVVGVYDFADKRYRVFMDDNMDDFRELMEKTDRIVGFNSLSFDNQLCTAAGIEIPNGKTYDLLAEIWKGDGLEPFFIYPTHAGYSLDACCAANFGTHKTGHGAMAPVDWQRGKIGKVIDYCLNDVALTKQLLHQVIATGRIMHPKKTNEFIKVRKPA